MRFLSMKSRATSPQPQTDRLAVIKLTIGLVLLSSLAFMVGYLLGKEGTATPIIIEKYTNN
ncbi:MAG: hypothetical protein KGJ01_03035 [Patescibacteria group bacterium]|nr:hypothetical protein [Patescibacteria group bacterium]